MTSDNLTAYESALAALAADPESLEQKHKAVLALARAGSLDFALAEYQRLGLDKVRGHEDIMALGGRLYKDIFLTEQGAKARHYAHLSALQYEAAFAETGGYYAAINSATMALLSGAKDDLVRDRAQRVLGLLPISNGGQGEAVYFNAATRAEAFLLLGDAAKAQAALRQARDYDPMNFTALASTLKQFYMIADARDEMLPWLSEFTPPKAVHFAGHIFTIDGEVKNHPSLSSDQAQALKDSISEAIQSHDIGFGYGALAAGADILIAETLLEEGGELHVVLPVDKKIFLGTSVSPYGESWVSRFEACLENATSVTLFDDFSKWPDHILQHRASLSAMGSAIRRANALAVKAGQLLIWDGQSGQQGTAFDADIWTQTNRPQFVIDYPGARNVKPHNTPKQDYQFQAALVQSTTSQSGNFDNISDAFSAAFAARREGDLDLRQAVHLQVIAESEQNISQDLCSALPGSIHACELAANYAAVYHSDDYAIDFMGLQESGERVFALRELGG